VQGTTEIATSTALASQLTKRHNGFWSKTRASRTTSMATATAWRARNFAEGVMKLLVLAFGSSGQVVNLGLHSGVFLSNALGFFLAALFDECIVSVPQFPLAIG
jgi:hypothetical protein